MNVLGAIHVTNEGLEPLDDGLHLEPHGLQALRGCKPLARKVDEYRAGRINIHLRLDGLRFREFANEEWLITYHRALDYEVPDPVTLGRPAEGDQRHFEATRRYGKNVMLVEVREITEEGENLIPSIARLDRFDDVAHLFRKATDAPLGAVPLSIRCRDGKCEVPVVGRGEPVGVGDGDGVDGVIEGRAQAMHKISDDGSPAPGGVRLPAKHEIERYLSSIRIELSVKYTTITCEQGIGIAPQVTQMFTSPTQPGIDLLDEDISGGAGEHALPPVIERPQDVPRQGAQKK